MRWVLGMMRWVLGAIILAFATHNALSGRVVQTVSAAALLLWWWWLTRLIRPERTQTQGAEALRAERHREEQWQREQQRTQQEETQATEALRAEREREEQWQREQQRRQQEEALRQQRHQQHARREERERRTREGGPWGDDAHQQQQRHRHEDRQERGHAKRTSTAGDDSGAWWDVLGVKPQASLEEVKAAYRTRIKQYHPDRVAGLGEEIIQLAKDRSRRLNEAYEAAKAARAARG
jgi:DnaJ-domain-containing protein 1